MDRNEKARNDLKMDMMNKERDEKMIAAIKEVTKALPTLKELLKLKKEDLKLLHKIQEIVLSKPNKIEPDFEYEADIEYQKLIAEKQIITNKLLFLQKENEITKLEDEIKDMTEKMVSYKAQVKYEEGE